MSDNGTQPGQNYSGGFAFGQPTPPPAQATQYTQQPTPPPAQAPQYTQPTPPPAAPAASAPAAYQDPTELETPPAPTQDPNYVFAKHMASFTTTVTLPPHALKFDEARFINLLAGSISLSRDEKKKIIDSIPTLRQAQVDELIRIFEEEREKFIELSPKHGAQLEKLEKEHLADWRDIELMYKAQNQGQQDQANAEEIRKQLGL